jgi:hypothetical protein
MNDFRMDTGFRNHPKIRKLQNRLGEPAVLGWITLIASTAEYKPLGILQGMDVEEIELAAMWSGESGALVAALLDFRLLDKNEDGLSFHNWEKRQSWVVNAPERSRVARENAKKGWETRPRRAQANGNGAARKSDDNRPASKTLAELEAEQLREDR